MPGFQNRQAETVRYRRPDPYPLTLGEFNLFLIPCALTNGHTSQCHCNAEWTTLPRYSLLATGSSDHPRGSSSPTCACSGGSATLHSTFSRYHHSPTVAPSTSRPSTAEQH